MAAPTEIASLSPAALAAWPGEGRRNPPRSDRAYLVLSVLARQIREEVSRLLRDRTDARVLDVGCGVKPYLPFVAGHASTYIGIDSVSGPRVDLVAPAELLPCDDASFDLVLCTQVLEHLHDPGAALAEIYRVLAPGGGALISTHGVHLYHPSPEDNWRWTHAGLVKEVTAAGEWSDVRVQPNGNVVACLGYIAAQFLGGWGGPSLGAIDRIRPSLVYGLNYLVEAIDRRFPAWARVPASGSLSANYLVTAVKG
jgi:SAM-dependent methyltransferase